MDVSVCLSSQPSICVALAATAHDPCSCLHKRDSRTCHLVLSAISCSLSDSHILSYASAFIKPHSLMHLRLVYEAFTVHRSEPPHISVLLSSLPLFSLLPLLLLVLQHPTHPLHLHSFISFYLFTILPSFPTPSPSSMYQPHAGSSNCMPAGMVKLYLPLFLGYVCLLSYEFSQMKQVTVHWVLSSF